MKIFKDHRGELAETYVNNGDVIMQEKITKSKKDVFRGLHRSMNQTKRFLVIEGKVKDYIIDVEKKTLKTNILNAWDEVVIEKGLAHGFMTLSTKSIVRYLSDDVYDEKQEITYSYKDFGINLKNPILSKKDSL